MRVRPSLKLKTSPCISFIIEKLQKISSHGDDNNVNNVLLDDLIEHRHANPEGKYLS